MMKASTRYKSHRLLLAGLAVVILAAGWGYRYQAHRQSPRHAAVPVVYDANTAMTLAGVQVPASLNSYYFFYLKTSSDKEKVSSELAGKLIRASREKDYLGITGPDPARNLEILGNALKTDADRPLQHLTLIYVGPHTQQKTVERLVAGRKLKLRYVIYP